MGFNLVFLFGVKTRCIRLNLNERGVVQNINIQKLKGIFCLPTRRTTGRQGARVENSPRGSMRNGIVIFDNCFELMIRRHHN